MQPIQRLLGSRQALTRLEARLTAQSRLLEQVRGLLEPALAQHCSGAILAGKTLTLLVAGPVWGSRLRYLAPQLERQLQQQGLGARRLRVRVVPPEGRPARRRPRRARPLSANNAKLLRDTAAAVGDRQLGEALLRLSRHTE